MANPANVTLLNELTKIERTLIVEHDYFVTPKLLGVFVDLKRDYEVSLQVGDIEQSFQSISTFEEAQEYIESTSLGYTIGDLTSGLDITRYVLFDGIQKCSIAKDTILYIDQDRVKRLIESSQPLTFRHFLLREVEGLSSIVEPLKEQAVTKNDFAVNLDEYDYKVRFLIDRFEESHSSELEQKRTLEAFSNNLELLHPCLYGAWQFALKYRRLPRKIGRDKSDERLMWRFIEEAYEAGNREWSVKYLDKPAINFDGMWKQYHETHSANLLKSLLSCLPK